MTTLRRCISVTLILGLFTPLVLSGCGKSKPYLRSETKARRDVRDVVDRDNVTYAVDISDPIEGWNRGVYRFNYYFDKYVFLPVVGVYSFVMPDVAEKGVHNAIKNIGEVNNFINATLQLKPTAMLTAFWRFFFNTLIGVGGLYDVATPMGLPEWKEDFGQTLGHYGVGNGPYLVLPIFGPSNLRDGIGLGGDFLINSYTDPFNLLTDDDYALPYAAVKAIDTRRFTAFRYYGSGSPFEYELVRMLYTQVREVEISK
jgi:phospholipid-binding lipoprotein MlaA